MTPKKKSKKKIDKSTKAFLEKMEKVLLQEKEELRKRLKTINKERPTLTTHGAPSDLLEYDEESTDAATQQQEVDRILATEEYIYRALERIDHALDKIKKGTYGICENCGKKISKARLKVIPSSNLCIECQKLQEKKFM